MSTAPRPIEIGLNAAIVAVADGQPLILVVAGDTLPFGPFDPIAHRTFEAGLRAFVADQSALKLGYAEQLYTFGDRGRHSLSGDIGPHLVSVGYLALTRLDDEPSEALARAGASWRRWYEFFPWEDWRGGRPAILDETLLPALARWAKGSAEKSDGKPLGRSERVRLAFGADGAPWDEERALDRYELLYEAGLVAEAGRDGRGTPAKFSAGAAMRYDHRRILATAISRLRAKLKYRPVVFELMADEFTLTELQTTVEAISGRHLHKQNFRRLVEGAELVEPTGAMMQRPRGRPAQMFRFRREILKERPAPGFRLGGRG
ncbi:MAG TPA: NAD regulator [Bauldia sp.]|nr:NAD regulator [Bauldia sp.]